MVDAPRCPTTGQPMIRDTRPLTLAYKGRERTFPMPGWYCEESGESIFSRADLKVSDRELATLKAEVENLAGPDEVAQLRRKLGLTQSLASKVFGGGTHAFQKYERGETSTSRAMTNLLRIVARHPEELARMAQEAGLPVGDVPRPSRASRAKPAEVSPPNPTSALTR